MPENFNYKRDGPDSLTITLNTTKNGLRQFTIQCSHRYQDDWLQLREDDEYQDILHEFPESGPCAYRGNLEFAMRCD
ncbi:hypothetical protein Pmar_PMAR004556, partial [Perkinsus marinus ATCC 50983]